MATSLIIHKRITTTAAKAKELRKYVEPLITKAKDDSTHSRRVVFSYLKNKDSIKELFGAIAGKIGERPGGYTRVLKLMNRKGDNAEMAIIELVDFNENLLKDSKGKVVATKKTRRGNKVAAPAAETAATESAEETTENN
jgi:large subunit ribosomal protein L17